MQDSFDRYSLQGKNGIYSEWKHIRWYKEITKAVTACEQLKSQYRRKSGTEWYKSRVAIKISDNPIGWFRIYPAQKKEK